MPVMTNGTSRPYSGMFGPPRNTLLSKWDILFEKDPKEWIGFKPALGLHVYPCYACRHMFYSKRSFLYHINRRTVLLLYSCPGCPGEKIDKLKFYNRCSLLVHARKHFSLQEGKINLNNLEIMSLPFGLAGFVKDPDIPFLYDVEEQYNNRDVFVNSQFYAAKYEDRGKEIITLTPSNLVINKTSAKGETQALSVLQIAKNIPKCQFILLDYLNKLRRQARVSEETEFHVKSEPEDEDEGQSPETPLETQVDTTRNEDKTQKTAEMTLPVITKIESVEEDAIEADGSKSNEVTNNNDQPLHNMPNGEGTRPMYKCPECKKQLEESLIEHFMAENRPADISLKCDECRLICSSQCSYFAHIRIHDLLAPYICPDCGQEFHDSDGLNGHMMDICFHSSKSVRYRCPKLKCAKLFASSQTYSTHFALHMNTLYKCKPCRLTFEDLEMADEHVAANRDETDKHQVVQLYQCSVCTVDVGGPFDEIGCKNHIEWHMNDLSKCLYIYLCKYCKSYFRSTATYASHLVKCATMNKTKRLVCRKKRQDQPFYASKYETGDCKRCKSKIIYAKNKPIDLCRKCIFADSRASKLNENQNAEKNAEKTPEDNQDAIAVEEKLDENNSKNKEEEKTSEESPEKPSEIPKKPEIKKRKRRIRIREPVNKTRPTQLSERVVCILCKKHLPLWERKTHQRQCRYSKPEIWVERFDTNQLNENDSMKLSNLSPPSSDLDLSSANGSWSSLSRHSLDNSPSRPKRRRFFKPKRPEREFDLTAEKPIEFDGTYSCRLCDFVDSDRAKFHDHVKTHRQLSTAYQCMECGECFVVKRSLIIHIQHFHNIHNYESYFVENDCFDKQAVEQLAKSIQMPHYVKNNVKENQCKVCLQEFDSKDEHDKHFRVHGMAFLLQKNNTQSTD